MFVTVEGIDGSGKSTLARSLASALGEKLGAGRVVLTREPTEETEWGRRLRRSEQEGRLPRDEEINHYHQDRLHHLETLVKPALKAGKIVVSDRYVDSLLAYQATDVADADRLYARLSPELLEPDLTLMLELPVAVAAKRIAASRKGGANSFEREETLKRAAAIYASRKGARYHRLDADQPADALVRQALDIVMARLAAAKSG